MSDRDAPTDERAPLAEPAPSLDAAPEPFEAAPDASQQFEDAPDADWGPGAARGHEAAPDASRQFEDASDAVWALDDAPEAGWELEGTAGAGREGDGTPGAAAGEFEHAPEEVATGFPAGRVRASTPAVVRSRGPRVTYKTPSGKTVRGGSGKNGKNLIFAFVAFVVVAGVAMVFALQSGGSGGGTPVRTGGVAASAASYRFRMGAPTQIGAWSKLDDQSPVDQFRTEVAESGVQQPFAVIYTDQASESAIAWGGVGTPYGKGTVDSRLSAFFITASRNVGGGTAGPREDVDPGTLGGTAQCATVDGVGISMVVCGWTGDYALMGFEFSAGTLEQDEPAMKSMLAAIVLPA